MYFVKYVVISSGDSEKKVGETLRDDEYRDLKDQGFNFVAKKGAEAIQELIENLDLQKLYDELKQSTERQKEYLDDIKRIKITQKKVIDYYKIDESSLKEKK